MALSDKRILEELENGNVVINPFNTQNLSSSSYDVTLGEFYYKPIDKYRLYMMNNKTVFFYNPYSELDVKNTWKLEKAQKWSDITKDDDYINKDGISENDLVILIEPGESLLCHTNEFIGGKNIITTMMKSRSSFGRNFLETCSCAGWGDVGYVNRWTMEIRNNSKKFTIPLIVGRRVAQIVFIHTGDVLKQYSETGKYQTKENFEELEKTWSPEDMLPKMYLDREIKHL